MKKLNDFIMGWIIGLIIGVGGAFFFYLVGLGALFLWKGLIIIGMG